MSVVKNTYSTSHALSTRYLQIEKDTTTGIIIIDDFVAATQVEVHTEIDRQVAWLQIKPGFELTILDEGPSGISAFSPTHDKWSQMRLYAQSDEVFVVEHGDEQRTIREAVTGYEMDSNDTVYVKIDQTADTVTIYQ